MALKISYKEPVTEVKLPMSGYNLLMKPMTMGIRKAIAVSQINTFSERLKFMTKILWDRIQNKDAFNNNYLEFISNIFVEDLDMMIYGMLCSTYKEPLEMTLVCPNCGETFVKPVNISKTILELNINLEQNNVKEMFRKNIEFQDFGLVFTVRISNISEIIAAMELYEKDNVKNLADSVNASNLLDMLMTMGEVTIATYVEKVTDADGNVEEFNVLTNKAKFKELVELLENLPQDVLDSISDAISEIPYKAVFGVKTKCPNKNCKYNKKPTDIIMSYSELFFPSPSFEGGNV